MFQCFILTWNHGLNSLVGFSPLPTLAEIAFQILEGVDVVTSRVVRRLTLSIIIIISRNI